MLTQPIELFLIFAFFSTSLSAICFLDLPITMQGSWSGFVTSLMVQIEGFVENRSQTTLPQALSVSRT